MTAGSKDIIATSCRVGSGNTVTGFFDHVVGFDRNDLWCTRTEPVPVGLFGPGRLNTPHAGTWVPTPTVAALNATSQR